MPPSYVVSSVSAAIEVISGREGTFRVRCTSTGGRTERMVVDGPEYFIELEGKMIESVGVQLGIGNDTYTGTTSTLSGGCDGDIYQCTASNGVVPDPTHSVRLRGIYHPHFACSNLYPLSSICCSFIRPIEYITDPDISYISDSGVESAIRRSHSDWICSTLQ